MYFVNRAIKSVSDELRIRRGYGIKADTQEQMLEQVSAESLGINELVKLFPNNVGFKTSQIKEKVEEVVFNITGIREFDYFKTLDMYEHFLKSFRLATEQVPIDSLENKITNLLRYLHPQSSQKVIHRMYCELATSIFEWIDEKSPSQFRDLDWVLNKLNECI